MIKVPLENCSIIFFRDSIKNNLSWPEFLTSQIFWLW